MIVYLLYIHDYMSSDKWVSGVFSTREKAEATAKNMISKHFHYHIEEEEVQ